MGRLLRLLPALALLASCSSSSGSASPIDAGPEDVAATDAPNGDGSGNCADGGSDAGCVAYVSCADLTTPAVSFGSDVLPVFTASCGIGGQQCHGDPSSASMTGQPYLGQAGVMGDAAQIIAGLVGQVSAENPQMNLVTAGKPTESYLMHKVDGDACRYVAECDKTANPLFKNCGVQMPFNSTVLDSAKRDTIRRWIAQGAQNN